jgi:hypothetical protein
MMGQEGSDIHVDSTSEQGLTGLRAYVIIGYDIAHAAWTGPSKQAYVEFVLMLSTIIFFSFCKWLRITAIARYSS